MSEEDAGNYTVSVTLEDAQGQSKTYDIEFEFVVPEV